MPRSKRPDPNGNAGYSAYKAAIEAQAKGVQADTSKGVRADWREVEPTLIIRLVLAVTGVGGAVLLGHDRSGSLYAVTIFAEGAQLKKYFHAVREYDELVEWLEQQILIADESA